MKDRFLPGAFILFIAIARPLAGASLNLLTNGAFDHDLGGWSHTPTATWSFALGGTALLFTSPTPGSEVLSQCVGVEGGNLYTVSAAVNQGGDGDLALRVRWFDAAGCGGTVLGGSTSLDFAPPANLFEPKSRVLVSPGSAHSAQVVFVLRAETTSGIPFVVDDVAFASAPSGEILTLPTAASIQGALGQRFQTDLWVRNTTAVARRFVLYMHCPDCGTNPEGISLNLAPLETRVLPDVIADHLGGGFLGRAGAIEISYDPREGAIEVFARIVTANADRPGNGTSVPALRQNERRTRASYIGLAGLGGAAGVRVNAGAYNPNDDASAELTFSVYGPSGDLRGTLARVWGAHEWFQLNDVLAQTGVAAGDASWIVVTSSLPVFPYVIAVDNRSGDATWLTPAPEVSAP